MGASEPSGDRLLALRQTHGQRHVQALDGQLRAECLNALWFLSMADARESGPRNHATGAGRDASWAVILVVHTICSTSYWLFQGRFAKSAFIVSASRRANAR